MATLKSAKIEITENSERKVVEITDGGEISFDMGKKALSAPQNFDKNLSPRFSFCPGKPFYPDSMRKSLHRIATGNA
ncbi:MAG: hypothetical protein ACLUKN_09905 [Bacilli bacterium]